MSKCPVMHDAPKQASGGGTNNRDWWPNQLKLGILHQHSDLSNPMQEGFRLCRSFQKPGAGCG